MFTAKPPDPNKRESDTKIVKSVSNRPQEKWLVKHCLAYEFSQIRRAQPDSSDLYCSLSLGNVDYSTYLSGSTSWTSTKCGIADNSTTSCALYASGSASINAPVAVAGGACGVQVTGLDLLYSRAVDDPFATNTTLQAQLGSSYPSGAPSNITGAQANGNQTLPPGHYGQIPGNATLKLSGGGVYYFDSLAGNATSITGATSETTATIVFKNDTNTSFPNNMPTIDIKPPESGTFAGVSIASLDASPFKLVGGANIAGSIYFLNSALTFSGNSGQACLQFIGNTVKFTGSSNMVNDTTNCAFFSGSQIKRRILQVIN